MEKTFVLRILTTLAALVLFAVSASARELINVQEEAISTKRNGLLIFVSFSMPSSLLIKLDAIARQAGGKLLIRGLKNNSFKETFAYIKQMQSQSIAVEIDPQAFEHFDIKLVPAFVVNEGSKFDKLVGNVSVYYALEQFAQHGQTAEKSKMYLKKLGNYETN